MIKEGLLQNRDEIKKWLYTSNKVKQDFKYIGNGSDVTGYGLVAGQTSSTPRYNANIVLKKKDPTNPQKGYF
ncbi:MAG: hypothetical protein ACKO96_21520, partial [Flammeovirgaceae bacterium]